MAIPYNPSSFATNKTILEAIEELKNYLKDNPCYKVYYVNTAYVVGTYTYNLSDVDDPDGTMTPIDVVIFNNSYYASVTNVDTNTFDIDPAISFKGATGATGATGPQGVSITGVAINASDHLIITLSSGSTIDAGLMPSASFDIVIVDDTAATGTFNASDLTQLKQDCTLLKSEWYGYRYYLQNYQYGILHYVSFYRLGTGTCICYEIAINDTTGVWTRTSTILRANPRGTEIDSQTATSGQVLTADGNGGASWTTVSSGGYDNTVSITTTSGTFSDEDFAKLGYGDSTIVYTDAYSVSTVYKLKIETASILEFEAIDATSRNSLKLIDVNKTTKAYSMTSIAMITSATISSGTATSGKVLTANGSGGTSWETAGGGGGKYQHNIRLVQSSGYSTTISIITSDSTPYSSGANCINAIINYMSNATQDGSSSTKFFIAQGYNGSVSVNNLILNGMYSNNQLQLVTNSGAISISPTDTLLVWSDTVVEI